MEGIFISYRREESAGHAGRIYDRLRERFGRDRVFMDVSAIEPGVDFVEAIDRAVGSCTVLLVVIGRRWLDCTDASGRRRLDDPRDFIRLEVGTALRRNIRVIPVLVQDAAMPGEGDLPDDLKLLARRNAFEINDSHWDSNMAQLEETLGRVLGDTAGPAPPGGTGTGPTPAVRKNRLVWLISSITAIVVALAGLFTGVESLRNSVVRLFGGSSAVTTTNGTTTPTDGQGPAMVTIPRVIGMKEQEAVATIRSKGLDPKVARQILSEAPPGMVTQQEPPAETNVTAGAMVHLIVAVPPERPEEPPPGGEPQPPPQLVTVPKLAGTTLGKAEATLAKAGLQVGAVERRESGKAEPGTVIGQTPKAGARLARGKKVSLVVAVKPPEPELVTVPNVVKQPLERAVKMLEEAGLRPGAETPRPTDQARPGTVMDQKIKGGTTARRGTAVDLLVAVQPADGGTSGGAKVIASGNRKIPQTYLFDLDSGKLVQNGDADIWFEAETETERYLTPKNGAALGFTREKPSFEVCSKVRMAERRIPIQRFPESAYACVRTSRGNLSAFKLLEPVGPSPGVMLILFSTWERR